MIGDNFAKAVTGAIAETRRQWQDFQSELTARYGEERAELMICTLTRDDQSMTAAAMNGRVGSSEVLPSALPLR